MATPNRGNVSDAVANLAPVIPNVADPRGLFAPLRVKPKVGWVLRFLLVVVVAPGLLSAGMIGQWPSAVTRQTGVALLHVLHGGNDTRTSLTSLAFSGDGRLLVSASDSLSAKDWQLRLWDVHTGRLLRVFTKPGAFTRIAISHDGKLVASVHLAVKLWDTGTGHLVHSITTENGVDACCFAFSPDGHLLVAEDWSGTPRWVRLWDTRTGALVRKFGGPQYAYQDHGAPLGFSPDGRTLVVEAESNGGWPGLDFWDVATGRFVRRLSSEPFAGSLHSLAFAPDGAMVGAVSAWRTFSTLIMWDLRTGRQLDSPLTYPRESDAPSEIAFSPDGRILALAWFVDYGQVIRFWDVRRQVTVLTLRGDGGTFASGVSALTFSPDGTLLAAVTGSDIMLWDVHEVLKP